MDPLYLLSSHSNLTALCTKYGVNIDSLKVDVKQASLSIKTCKITLDKYGRNLKYKSSLEDAKYDIIKEIDYNLQQNFDAKNLLESSSVLVDTKFKSLLAENIIEQLNEAYLSASYCSWLKGSIQFIVV